MANYNRNYSADEFESLLEKYVELCRIREAAVLLTGEENYSSIVKSLEDRARKEVKFKCPAHFYLDKTPSKRRAVEEAWEELVLSLSKAGSTGNSLEYLVDQMRSLNNIEDARNYIEGRRKMVLDSKTEKTFKKRFNG
jgi:hypothetical protein